MSACTHACTYIVYNYTVFICEQYAATIKFWPAWSAANTCIQELLLFSTLFQFSVGHVCVRTRGSMHALLHMYYTRGAYVHAHMYVWGVHGHWALDHAMDMQMCPCGKARGFARDIRVKLRQTREFLCFYYVCFLPKTPSSRRVSSKFDDEFDEVLVRSSALWSLRILGCNTLEFGPLQSYCSAETPSSLVFSLFCTRVERRDRACSHEFRRGFAWNRQIYTYRARSRDPFHPGGYYMYWLKIANNIFLSAVGVATVQIKYGP